MFACVQFFSFQLIDFLDAFVYFCELTYEGDELKLLTVTLAHTGKPVIRIIL